MSWASQNNFRIPRCALPCWDVSLFIVSRSFRIHSFQTPARKVTFSRIKLMRETLFRNKISEFIRNRKVPRCTLCLNVSFPEMRSRSVFVGSAVRGYPSNGLILVCIAGYKAVCLNLKIEPWDYHQVVAKAIARLVFRLHIQNLQYVLINKRFGAKMLLYTLIKFAYNLKLH